MHLFKKPSWIGSHQYSFSGYEEIPPSVFAEINGRLDAVIHSEPLVSVIIAAWNEEINILNCISSLSRIETNIPFEIIVVNNNSTDNTQKTIDNLRVRSLYEPVPGCGPARQLGQENARGKYILLADADCIYPPSWINEMMQKLRSPGVVCVYGRYSFIDEKGYPRWKLFILEKLKDLVAEIRHYKRPYLNAYGISMGYIKEYGLKVGYVKYKIWGDDGRLCFDLMQFGSVKQVKSGSARAWTNPRTLQRDGSFANALWSRIKIEASRFFSFFSVHPPHNTKVSRND